MAGLGNPGERYSRTRHNAGFMVLDLLGHRIGAEKWKAMGPGLAATARPGHKSLLLLKPQTFMNRSGLAVAPLAGMARSVLVIHDDLDLPFGSLRIKCGGGHGGQGGVRSIIEELGTGDFCRVKVGIGRPPESVSAPDYVLSGFTPEEEKELPPLLGRAADAVLAVIEEGPARAMNLFNTRKTAAPENPDSVP